MFPGVGDAECYRNRTVTSAILAAGAAERAYITAAHGVTPAIMNIRISKESEAPLRDQMAEQVVFQIATGKLKPGQPLPSVRQLARRLNVHYNTVSEAYQDLIRRKWLEGRRGRRVTVRTVESAARAPAGLDDLINTTIRVAREQGFSLQALRERVRERLLAAPPDHILVVEADAGLGRVLQEEIRAAINFPVQVCTREELAANPGLSIGAQTVAAHYAIGDVNPLVPKDRPAIPLDFSPADEQVNLLRLQREASIVAIVSVSEAFLKTALSVLASASGRKHALKEFLLPLPHPKALAAADVVFADSIALREIRHRNVVHYPLVAATSLHYLASALGGA